MTITTSSRRASILMGDDRREPGYVPYVDYDDVTTYDPYPAAPPAPEVAYEPSPPHEMVRYRPDQPNLPQAVVGMYKGMGTFHGRLSRPGFWLGTLGTMVGYVTVLVALTVLTVLAALTLGSTAANVMAVVTFGVGVLGALGGSLAVLSGAVRRLHDSGLPGALVLLSFLVPPFGWIATAVLLSRSSQQSSNRYGHHPDAR